MNNDAEVKIKFKNYVTGEKKLEKYAETLKTIKAFSNSVNSDSGNIKSIEKNTDSMSKKINTAFNYGVIRQFTHAIRGAVRELSRLTEKSTAYLENVNLYQVAFNGAYQEADKFINKISQMYGLDESNLTRTVGIFKQLSNAMNLSTETGTKLSTLLTQMSIDISSLYNIDLERASSTLQSALAGLIKIWLAQNLLKCWNILKTLILRVKIQSM